MPVPAITLSQTTLDDLHTLFIFQQDREAIQQAAFTPRQPIDKTAYLEKFTPFLSNPDITMCTIRLEDRIVGSVAKFVMHGDAEITFWIDREFQGQGIASAALSGLLERVTTRPIFGRVAYDNLASQKVLKKCGFIQTGKEKAYAKAREKEIEEFIYRLDR